jgi:Zn finger protein HypA/HybF involved in hydrogenase expression
MKISDLSRNEIIDLVEKYDNINQILKVLNVNSNGSGAYKTFRDHCELLNVDLPKFQRGKKFNLTKKIPIKNILVEHSTYKNIARLKIRLIKENIFEYKCNECGNEGEWNGKNLKLQLDHINGIRDDHRKENLRFLCPNCHSQTETFAGKNTIKK